MKRENGFYWVKSYLNETDENISGWGVWEYKDGTWLATGSDNSFIHPDITDERRIINPNE